jgi:hypothetical protein
LKTLISIRLTTDFLRPIQPVGDGSSQCSRGV